MSRSIAAQGSSAPDTIAVTVGSLTLRGLVWRPGGTGPFPAVLFNHGSYRSADPMSDNAPGVLGPVFAQHGFVFLVLFRQGIGLSRGRGTADGDLMARALAAEGIAGRNRVQLQLLEGEEFHEALAGLAFLRSLPAVDVHRVAIVGHSFGGSLALLVAARDTAIRAAVVFGAAAASWNESPLLRARLLAAVRRTHAPVLFIHAANDYSLAPGKALASEMQRLRKPHRLKVYPAIGHESRDGHNLRLQGDFRCLISVSQHPYLCATSTAAVSRLVLSRWLGWCSRLNRRERRRQDRIVRRWRRRWPLGCFE